MTPTAVIADDDEMARERLKDLLARIPLVRVVGEAADGGTAVRMVDELEPDLLFLDVQMPVLTGIEVARRITHQPAIVFTTAYDHHAATAFELAAVDYLVKPFGPERFQEAVERAVASLDRPETTSWGGVRRLEALDPTGPIERLFIRDKERILPITVSDVIRFEAEGDYVGVHTPDHSVLVRLSLKDLEQRLVGRFLRVHRSHLVNLDHVRSFEQHDEARLTAVMSDGTRIVASRARSRELRRRAR